MAHCLKCGDTGIKLDGTPCDCGAGQEIELPVILDMPAQYQMSMFNKSLLPNWLHPAYGSTLESIVSTVKTTYALDRNYLICSPPNSGKTTFAYTILRILYSANIVAPEIMDINEIRKLFSNQYSVSEQYDLLTRSKLAIVKIPMDVPAKFVESVMTIIDLRARHSGYTIFLYDGSKFDLINQDKYSKFQFIDGDGSYHTVKVISYEKDQDKKSEV